MTTPFTVAPGQTDVFIPVKMLNDSDGLPATGITASTTGHAMKYWRFGAAAVVTDAGSAADMTGLNDSHTDWEFDEIGVGYYWCAWPDAAFASGAEAVMLWMETDSHHPVPTLVTIDPTIKFNGLVSSVTSTTTTFPSGPVVKKGDIIYVAGGTGQGQTRLVTSASGQVATHEAFDTAINNSDSVVTLYPGDSTLFDGVHVTKIAGNILTDGGTGGQQVGEA